MKFYYSRPNFEMEPGPALYALIEKHGKAVTF